MINYVVLYRGHSFRDAELLAISLDDAVMAHVAQAILAKGTICIPNGDSDDLALQALTAGRRRALQVLAKRGAVADAWRGAS